MYFILTGMLLLLTVIGLFWLKDRLQSQRLARVAHSEPMMRLAVIGAALVVIGILLIVAGFFENAQA